MEGVQTGKWLIEPEANVWDGNVALADKIYVGVDFGTATTVVSVVKPGGTKHTIEVEPLVLSQPSAHGGLIRDVLVNTVLSWYEGKLLFGADAYRNRPRLVEGVNTFSSFKMGMGLDLGPEYPSSYLASNKSRGIVIERPADATREFIKLLVRSIELEVGGDPSMIRYAFTVPAAFQANQRRELIAAIESCGIKIGESCLIDEPNAAFLSHLYCEARGDGGVLVSLAKTVGVKVLVFDFGAGTCDLSLIDFSISADGLRSKNIAISKFTALGGDDIDRKISELYLLQQLVDATGASVDMNRRDFEAFVLKRLMPAAESLKIAISNSLAAAGVSSLRDARKLDDLSYQAHSVQGIKLPGVGEVSISQPMLSLHQYLDVMEEFCGNYDDMQPGYNVAGPVSDVLAKAGLAPDEINAVLFIGGSASSTLIRSAVMDCFPSSVHAVVPADLRVHVSQGAAIHSFGIHGLGMDFVTPIVSEAICVAVRGDGMETLIPVSTPLPTRDFCKLQLQVAEDGQPSVDIPVCAGSKQGLIGILSISPPRGKKFLKGDVVEVLAGISKEKVLDVRASVAGVEVRASMMNPLSNGAPTESQRKLIKMKQRFNESILKNSGRPDAKVVREYADAASAVGEYELAADLLVALLRISPDLDLETNIGFYYGKAGESRKCVEWHERAYKKRPSALTAYNMYCVSMCSRDRQEAYLRESLSYDHEYVPSLSALAKLLERSDPRESMKLRGIVIDLLELGLDSGEADTGDLDRLLSAAKALGREDIVDRVNTQKRKLRNRIAARDELFSEESLAESMRNKSLLSKGQ